MKALPAIATLGLHTVVLTGLGLVERSAPAAPPIVDATTVVLLDEVLAAPPPPPTELPVFEEPEPPEVVEPQEPPAEPPSRPQPRTPPATPEPRSPPPTSSAASPPSAPTTPAVPGPTSDGAQAVDGPAAPARKLNLTLSNKGSRAGTGRGSSQTSKPRPSCSETPSKPRPTKKVRIGYPAQARSAGVEGRIVLRAHVGADGAVRRVEVLDSPGALLEEPAVRTLKRWQFTPAQACGKAVAATFTIARDFRLGD